MPKRLTRPFAILCGLCALAVTASGGDGFPARLGGVPLPESKSAAVNIYAQHAADGIQTLQQWYSQKSGLYATPAGWWNAANSITVLADYSRATGDKQYLPAIENTFRNANGAKGNTNFLNEYDDDEGWWALAWIDAYDLTGSREYLAMAEVIFADIATEWNTSTCGGGVWWQKPANYKNAIANELFLSVAASLANRTTGAESASYLKWAKSEWTWFKASGMIGPSSLVNDGLNAANPTACKNNGQTTWSYNQGVILGGLVELHKADPDPALLLQAHAIADAAIAILTVKGVLVDTTVSGGDAPQFKGIFVRNLARLYMAAPQPEYKAFIDANADSIWASDQGPNRVFGGLWQGPFDSANAIRQTSALDALVAAAEIQ